MINQFVKSKAGTWQGKIEELKAARAEYGKYYQIMTPFEQAMIQKSINEFRAEIEPAVLAGAFSELDIAVNNFNSKLARVKDLKRKERASWDAGRLSTEMNLIRSLVDTVVRSPKNLIPEEAIARLENIYRDASESGDAYKQRAAAEVFTGLVSMVGSDYETRYQANFLASKAERDCEAKRTSKELEAADQEAKNALDGVNHWKQMLCVVDGDLGHTAPNGELGSYAIYNKLARLHETRDGLKFAENTNDPIVEENMFDF